MDAAASTTQDGENPDSDDFLLWILVWSELAAFGILFAAFMIAGTVQADRFAAARHHLDTPLAVLNTAILLTSGWLAARAARNGIALRQARSAMIGAALLGFLFAAIKVIEYGHEIGAAGNEAYGVFFELYFILTGFHLLHVVFGAFVMLLVSWRMSRANVVLITTLWHVFDLIWVVMFPLVYLT